MVRAKRSFVDGRYGQMHLRMARPKSPSALPLVCLHMFPQSGRNFANLIEPLAADRQVIAPDFPGHGESTAPQEQISASDYAASIWDVIDSLVPNGQVDLFGIHAGGKLAVEVARQRPADVRQIVLSSAAVLLADELAHLAEQFSEVPLDEEGTRWAHLWRMLCNNRAPDVTFEMLAIGLAEMLRGGEKYEWGHHAVFEYNRIFPEAIAELPHRIDLLNPADDLYAMTPRTMKHIQNGALHDLPQWNHGYMDVHAVEAAELIRTLLDASHTNH